jgi:dTDP-4-amino-4,6-dideoxygalactose transaminase
MLNFTDPASENLFLKKKICNAINRVINSNNYILGSEVKSFENKFAKYIGAKYCVGTSNGTDALILALKALDVKEGDEIITTAHTAVATAAAIVECKATPVFVDIDETYNIDISKIRENITKKTKAIIIVHIYGNPANLKELSKIKNVPIIEDCSQAHGAMIENKKVGNFGKISCFSFYPTKNLGCIGDGGAIVTNNIKICKKIKLLREYGWKVKNNSIIQGTNKRLDELQAAILNVKINYLDFFNKRRVIIAKKYLDLIKNKKLILPIINHNNFHVFHLFVIRVKYNLRKKIILFFKKNKINLGIHYPIPINKQEAYKKYNSKNLVYTNLFAKEIISIPIYPLLNDRKVNAIIKLLNKFN